MKQVFLSGGGEIQVFDAPVPGRLRDSALIRNAFSVISSGTEGAAVTKNSSLMAIYEKAVSSRERAEQVWQMAKRDGLAKTYTLVTSKLQEFSPIGYSSAGIVVEADSEIFPFSPGDRVACMGVGFASHADYAAVPRNLIAKVPDGVKLEEAAFGAIACIALQGIRRLELSPGEAVAVIGLGLIGQIAVRLLRALGYEAFGADTNPRRVEDACTAGLEAWDMSATDGRSFIQQRTQGRGLDGVILCAATDSDEPVNFAFDLLRPRGRVSLVGDVGLGLERAKMYRKELELRISCSYGPGRYDPAYELEGTDYPIGLVRWTEGRNLELFLRLLANGRLSMEALVSAKFPVADAKAAYVHLKQGGSYGIVLDYDAPAAPVAPPREAGIVRRQASVVGANDRIGLGVIGVGSFARGVHLPNAQQLDSLFAIRGAASRSGATAASVAKRYGADIATSDYRALLDDKNIDAVLVSTRHASHAKIVLAALDAGKHVYVEKPMTTTVADGEAVLAKANDTGLIVRVGFNRRFAPMVRNLRAGIGTSGARFLYVRASIAAGADDWSNSAEEGGRFMGEATHFLDLCNWFMGAETNSLSACFHAPADILNPNGSVLLGYPDGSAAQILYTAAGSAKMGKEYFEAFGNGRSGRLDDFKRLEVFGGRAPASARPGEKGQLEALREFGDAIRGAPRDGADARAGLSATWMAIEARRAASQSIVIPALGTDYSNRSTA